MTMAADLNLTETIEHSRRLLKERRDEDNLEFLEAAIERFPADPEVRLLYATALVPFQPDKAPWQIATAIQLDPDDPWRLTRAARLLFDLGELDASRSYAARASQLAPEDFTFESELANLGGKLAALDGHDALAEEALRAALESEPSEEVFARDLAEFLAERGRLGDALAVIDESLGRVQDREGLLRLRDSLVER